MPARLKFLRTDATELGRCLEVASRLALACPGVGLRVRHGNRDLLSLSPAADAGARLRAHLGGGAFSGLLPVRGALGAIAVAGFVSRPGAGRPGPDHQQLFVNGRPVRDPLLAQGVREACRDHFLQEPAGASWYLWVELPPDEVDVNVHPTKREVRFRDLPAVRGHRRCPARGAARRPRRRARPASPPAAGAPSRPGAIRDACAGHARRGARQRRRYALTPARRLMVAARSGA